jgi:hypothetical protein
LSQSLKSIDHLLRKLEVILMRNKLLRRLSMRSLSVTVCSLPLPNASAADDAYGTAYTTAVFAREVQVNTAAWWQSYTLGANSDRMKPFARDACFATVQKR